VGSLGTFWKGIPVAITIPGTDYAVGNHCAIASFNDSHPIEFQAIPFVSKLRLGWYNLV